MKFLSAENFTVKPLSEIAKCLKNKTDIAPGTVALTFDDGFQNFYERAFPVLSFYGFPATVFLVADYCGKYNDWQGNPSFLPRARLLTWEEINFQAMNNIEFGAHTCTHPDLTGISLTAAEREITESKTIIEEHTGRKVELFAYPYGKFNQAIEQIVAENYAAAVSVKLNKITSQSDIYALERIDAYYLSNRKIFTLLNTGFIDSYLFLRRNLRALKNKFSAH